MKPEEQPFELFPGFKVSPVDPSRDLRPKFHAMSAAIYSGRGLRGR